MIRPVIASHASRAKSMGWSRSTPVAAEPASVPTHCHLNREHVWWQIHILNNLPNWFSGRLPIDQEIFDQSLTRPHHIFLPPCLRPSLFYNTSMLP